MRAVFVGGSGRSGTTMTGAMLGAGPGCLCVPEMHFKIDLERWIDPADPPTGKAVLDRLERQWGYRLLGLSGPLDRDRRYGSAREVIEDLVRALARKAGRPEPETWIDQTPTNVHYGWLLADRYPGSAFVHVVRDGRAVAASVLPLDWGANDVRTAARTWAADVAAGLALESAMPDRVARVRYEDLVRDPAATLTAVCEALDLPFDPRMAEGGAFDRPAYYQGTHPLVARPPDASRIDRWRERLSDREVETFEHVAHSVLAHLGYPLEHGLSPRRPPLAWDVATRLRGRMKRWLVDPLVRRRRKRAGDVAAAASRGDPPPTDGAPEGPAGP